MPFTYRNPSIPYTEAFDAARPDLVASGRWVLIDDDEDAEAIAAVAKLDATRDAQQREAALLAGVEDERERSGLAGQLDHGNGAAAAGGIENLPNAGLSEFDGVSGRLWISYATAAVTGPMSRIMVASAGTAAAGCTLARLGVFDVAADGGLTLIARTASDTTIGADQYTPYEKPFATAGGYPATRELIAGRRYGFGWLQVADTPMKISGAFVLDPATPPIRSQFVDGQADIAASYAAGALTPHFTTAYLRVRP